MGAPACGDVMKLCIKVSEDGIIEDVRFKTFGCGSAIASSSYMTERVKGMTLEEAGAIRNTEIAKELSLPPVKLHCSMLAEDAIKSAIRDYKKVRFPSCVYSPAQVADLESIPFRNAMPLVSRLPDTLTYLKASPQERRLLLLMSVPGWLRWLQQKCIDISSLILDYS